MKYKGVRKSHPVWKKRDRDLTGWDLMLMFGDPQFYISEHGVGDKTMCDRFDEFFAAWKRTRNMRLKGSPQGWLYYMIKGHDQCLLNLSAALA